VDQKGLLVFVHDLSRQEIDINGAHRGTILAVTPAKKHPVCVTFEVKCERVRSVTPQLGVNAGRLEEQAGFDPCAGHILRSFELGTRERSVVLAT
jgi:hypothetical protein